MTRFPTGWDEPFVPDPDQEKGGSRRAAAHRLPGRPAGGSQDQAAARRSADTAAALATGASPRQEEIARHIYARLKAGADVDDVKSLIGDLSRAATEQAHRSSYGGCA